MNQKSAKVLKKFHAYAYLWCLIKCLRLLKIHMPTIIRELTFIWNIMNSKMYVFVGLSSIQDFRWGFDKKYDKNYSCQASRTIWENKTKSTGTKQSFQEWSICKRIWNFCQWPTTENRLVWPQFLSLKDMSWSLAINSYFDSILLIWL